MIESVYGRKEIDVKEDEGRGDREIMIARSTLPYLPSHNSFSNKRKLKAQLLRP
jgi:hypothetical protein